MDALVDRLGDRDAGVRGAAINAMTSGALEDEPPKALADALKDESAANRKAAVNGLSSFSPGARSLVSHSGPAR